MTTQGLEAARALANAYRSDPELKFIAVSTGGVTVEHHLLSLIAAQDNALYTMGEQLARATKDTTRDGVLEEAAVSLEEALEYGGAYGQKQRRPSNYRSAAHHVRTLKTGTP